MQGVTSRALEFTILTAARSGEARGARWDEIDMMGKVWTLPAHRYEVRSKTSAALQDQRLATA
jgi:integrase